MDFIKWLRILVYIAVVSLVNAVADYLPFLPAAVSTWVSRGIMAATVLCMFRLARANSRYRWAGIFRAAMLSCALITSFLFGSYVLSIAASLFSVLAVYLEYTAHAELVAEKDATLSRSWRNLFYWGLAAAILLSVGSTVTAAVLMSGEIQAGVSRISGIVTFLLKIPRFAVDVVHLLYLRKTISCLAD